MTRAEQSGRRILVLDGEASCRARVAAILETEGYSCDGAEDAERAAILLERGGHSLLIVDVRVPGAEELTAPAVILMTPYPVPDATARVNGRAVAACLEKPFDIDELVARVRDTMTPLSLARSLDASRASVTDTLRELELLERCVRASGGGVDQSLNARYFVDIGVQTILAMLRDIERVLAVDHDADRHGDRPASQALLAVLKETATYLERNEGALRSPAVGQLRQRLEQAVRGADSAS